VIDPPRSEVRARVLLITRNLPPLVGGMERLNRHMALELAREFDVAVIGPRGCAPNLSSAIATREVPARPLWRFFGAALLQAIAVARHFKPNVVLAGSGLTAPFAWLAARLAHAQFAVYVHGLDLIADHAIYRWFWRPCIRRADLCIANSRNTATLAAGIGVPQSRIVIVHPGVELPSGEPVTRNDFRIHFDLGDGALLLSVGRLIERKGLLEFVENALPLIAEKCPDVRLVVLGDENPQLLRGSSVGLGERIRQRAAELGVANNVHFIGAQDDQTLVAAYAAANVHVFPVRDVAGDVEGFGMVAVEAAAHGLPTVAFAVGGVPDAVADDRSGYLVEAADYSALAQRILDVLGRSDTSHLRRTAIEFAQGFSWVRFGEQIRAHLRQLTSRRR
jgi:phosphatidylinositol alpha-1,6-mannosyltransferase